MKIAKQIDYLGGMPVVTPKPVKTSDKAEDMLKFDLDNEVQTIAHYRERVKQAEALGEYALCEILRDILVQEQEHAIDLATSARDRCAEDSRGSRKSTDPMFVFRHRRCRTSQPRATPWLAKPSEKLR